MVRLSRTKIIPHRDYKKSESIVKAKQYVEQKAETQTRIIEMLNEIGPSIESLSNKMDSLKEHHQKNIVMCKMN